MAAELILIVEDNEKNRKLERDILQFHGYRTVTLNQPTQVVPRMRPTTRRRGSVWSRQRRPPSSSWISSCRG
jgi:DNA-binding NtrC family response regulator